ncbi:MAG TPA: sugar transferase [Thermoleophilaceae bacterium]|nr:sugar transferase [Thermoleophilaceae bacterium]
MNNRLRPPRRFTRVLAPPPEAQPHEGETLAERYSRMAHEGWRPAPVDFALRGLDILLASLALLLLAPLLAVIWALVRLGSRGPAIYRGVRVGKAGRVFTMFKFRTLQVDAESRLGPYLGAELSRLTEDELTRVGRRLRAAHLDELPQLVNVLTGDMSIVGPRPIRPAFFEELCEQIPQYWQRLVVPPGMTGFAQLRMTREMTWEEKLAHDLEYIADRSPRLYLGVVAETAASIPRRARAA